MAVDIERVKDLLGSGLDPSVVASALGTTPSYISQLLSDERFREEVLQKKMLLLQAASARDAKIDALEDRALDRLSEVMDFIIKPREVIHAAALLNRMQRRGTTIDMNLGQKAEVVKLTMPRVLVQNFIVNRQGEVIDVAGQSMVGMSAHQLMHNLQQIENARSPEEKKEGDNRGERYKKVASFIPATAAGGGELIEGELATPVSDPIVSPAGSSPEGDSRSHAERAKEMLLRLRARAATGAGEKAESR